METKKRTEKDRISAVLFIVVFLLVVVIVIMVLKTVDDKRAAQQAQEQQTINTMTYQPPVQDPGALVNGDVNTETPQNFEAVTVLPNSNSNSGGYTANAGNTGTGNTGGNGGNGGTGNGTGTGTGTGNTGGQTTQPMPTTAPANNPAPAPANQPTVVENQPTQNAPETAQYTPAETLPESGNGGTETQPVVNFTPYRLGSDRFDGNSGTWLNVYAEWTATAVSPTQVDINITLFSVHQSIDDPAHDNNVHFSIRELGNDQNIQFASMGSPRQKQAADNYAVTSTQIGTYTFTVDVAQGETKTFIVDAAWDYGGTYGSDKGRVKIDSLECGGGIQISR